ncbi:hypothetical protein G7Z17_g1666 [Cylindrodendrum hubeiense]|uniref:Uncharacterized protein n=1 Tax=Cylindrodendrum hubeiense TaxID=595255 RepID=A0A9P5HJ43_9HYPO|nr:hypothetical protein G7Z17_g1666 [Cylindrodendrum hubeiense]
MESWEGRNYYTRNTTRWVQLMNLSTAEWGIGFLPATLVAIPGHLNDTYDFRSDSIFIENASKPTLGSRHIENIIFGLVSGIVILWALVWLYVNRSEIFSPHSTQKPNTSDASSHTTSVTELSTLGNGFVKAADFKHQLQHFYYDGENSMLEVCEKDYSTEKISTDDIEGAGALFRKMYGLDLQLWATQNSRQVTPDARNNLMHQSDAILAEVRRQVRVWQVNMNDPTTAAATEKEKREIGEIEEILKSIDTASERKRKTRSGVRDYARTLSRSESAKLLTRPFTQQSMLCLASGAARVDRLCHAHLESEGLERYDEEAILGLEKELKEHRARRNFSEEEQRYLEAPLYQDDDQLPQVIKMTSSMTSPPPMQNWPLQSSGAGDTNPKAPAMGARYEDGLPERYDAFSDTETTAPSGPSLLDEAPGTATSNSSPFFEFEPTPRGGRRHEYVPRALTATQLLNDERAGTTTRAYSVEERDRLNRTRALIKETKEDMARDAQYSREFGYHAFSPPVPKEGAKHRDSYPTYYDEEERGVDDHSDDSVYAELNTGGSRRLLPPKHNWRQANGGRAVRLLSTRALADLPNKDTISRDNTVGDEARMADLLARAGKKMAKSPCLPLKRSVMSEDTGGGEYPREASNPPCPVQYRATDVRIKKPSYRMTVEARRRVEKVAMPRMSAAAHNSMPGQPWASSSGFDAAMSYIEEKKLSKARIPVLARAATFFPFSSDDDDCGLSRFFIVNGGMDPEDSNEGAYSSGLFYHLAGSTLDNKTAKPHLDTRCTEPMPLNKTVTDLI